MEYLVGVGLAALVCAFAATVGFDRERVFYPTVMAVIASYYVLFAVMGNSSRVLVLKSLMAAGFVALAVAGFKFNLWLVVAALAAHGVFDLFHRLLVQNRGVPTWWPGFCLAFDVLAAGILAVQLVRRSGFAARAAR